MSGLQTIPVGLIEPNPGQPRKDFDPDALEELAISIRTYGLLEPIIVRPTHGIYQIIAGERRWRAAQLAGLAHLPAVVRYDDDATAFELSMVENVVREDMNPLEEADGYQRLLEAGLDVATIAARLGKKQGTIESRLRLLRLAPAIRDLVRAGQLDLWRAGQMTRISHEGQFRVLRALNAGSLPEVNDVDRFVSAILLQETQSEMFEDLTPVSPAAVKAHRELVAELERAVRSLSAAAVLVDEAQVDGLIVAELADEAKRIAGRVGAKSRTQRAQRLAQEVA